MRRRRRSILRLCRFAYALFAVVGIESNAKAASFQLTWNAPPSCPSRDEIVAATLARLKTPIGEGRELFVRGTVQALGSEYVVHFTLKDDRGQELGEREVHVAGTTCADIEDPSSLVLAMMISVALPRDPLAAEPAPRAIPAVDAGRPLVARPRAPAATSVPEARHVALSAAAVGAVGTLPGASLGMALRSLYSSGAVAFGLEVDVLRSGGVPAGSETMSFALLELSARAGLTALRSERVELIPHLVVRGGVLRLSPSGFSRVDSTVRGIAFGGVGVLARLRVAPHILVEALPELQAVFVRDDIQVLDAGKLYQVHRAAPVEGRFSLGLSYEFR